MTTKQRFGGIARELAVNTFAVVVYVGFGKWMSPQDSLRRLIISALLFIAIFTVIRLIWPLVPDDRERPRRFWGL